jgi:hypothetical protein
MIKLEAINAKSTIVDFGIDRSKSIIGCIF